MYKPPDLVRQIRKYAEHGHGTTERPLIIYGQSGQTTIGLYIGQGLLNEAISESALKMFQDNHENVNVLTPTLAVQLCQSGYDSTYIFGIKATSNGTFSPIQNAIKSWANATCLSFSGSTKFTGPAKFTTPLLRGNRTVTTTNSTIHALHPSAECRTVQIDAGNGCADLAKKCGISAADFTKYNPGDDFYAILKPK
ncbi:uncharacterized protein BDV17DRAFT_295599 [Aspergillus undulatus]|uniref:uncharacterized protein n=1 Tax=Aspergillus undulatus TaxID=1810928 RepID=UPI003CCCB258